MTVTLGEVVTDEYLVAKAKSLYEDNYALNPPELRPRFESQPLQTRAEWFAKAARLPVSGSGYEAVCAKAKELYEESGDANLPRNSWKSLPLQSRVEWLNRAEREMARGSDPASQTISDQPAEDADEFTP